MDKDGEGRVRSNVETDAYLSSDATEYDLGKDNIQAFR